MPLGYCPVPADCASASEHVHLGCVSENRNWCKQPQTRELDVNQLHYLAYGSNLHPLRLKQRAPSATPLAVVRLSGQRLTFHKRSKDGSGKCNLTPGDGCMAYGVLYEMTSGDMNALDAAEGPGYLGQLMGVTVDSQIYTPTIYVARSTSIDESLAPYSWYRDLVVYGARYFGFPSSYISALQGVPSVSDGDVGRAQMHQSLLVAMAHHPALSRALPVA
ncbi:gamma-glutamylcyclotransferase family protein [Luteibacter yeojuensis]